ncbi:MAG: sel1 repeat family protein [Pseudomonadota bacterium]
MNECRLTGNFAAGPITCILQRSDLAYDHSNDDSFWIYWYHRLAEDMKMRRLGLTFAAIFLASFSNAEPSITSEDEFGILNPQDTGREMLRRKIEMGVVDSVTCSLGINATKYDNHELAKSLAERCAEAGFTKAMTWMSQMENNGLGGEYNPDEAAEWDRRAAEAGDPVGRFNHGLNLMRGHGIAQDVELGRRLVDQAAEDGLEIAKRLQGAEYDLNEVTPDADNWKYAPLF